MRKFLLLALAEVVLVIAGCGGGSASLAPSNNGQGIPSSGANVVTMTIDSGPDSSTSFDIDMPFVTVTVCQPGSTTGCATIPDVEVDTGSYGLRILSSALPLTMQPEVAANGQPVVECTQFIDGFSWGPVAPADVQVSGESASGVPVQVIGDPNFENEIPSACSGTGTEEDTVAAFGANGVLGVGPFAQDCGNYCASTLANGWYYACPSGGTSTSNCTEIEVAVSRQVTNPVVDFQTDDNGVIIEMPPVPDPGGAPTATGALVFGIDTEGNNALGGATVLSADPNYGDITTTFNGQSLPYSYFDTGSNAYYFSDSSIPQCPSTSGSSSSSGTWFCPSAELTLSATNTGQNGTVSNVTMNVANADSLFKNYPGNTAFDDLGASSGSQSSFCPNGSSDCYFDFGMPFFFGRNVYIAIAGANTSGGVGPFFAY